MLADGLAEVETLGGTYALLLSVTTDVVGGGRGVVDVTTTYDDTLSEGW